MTSKPKRPPDPEGADRPAAMETRHVFLDTEAYRRCGHDPDSPPLRALAEHVSTHRLILHTTDITLAEIGRQLREHAGEAAADINKARKLHERWQRRTAQHAKGNFPDFDVDKVAQAAFHKFDVWIRLSLNATAHVASQFDSLDIFKLYFGRKGVFTRQNSKEFPDAFVLATLEKWCKENSTTMYVVTKDSAFKEAANATGVLIAVDSLAALLQAIAATDAPGIVARATAVLDERNVLRRLQKRVDRSLSDLIFTYTGDLADGEAVDAELIGDIKVKSCSVVFASPTSIGVLVTIEAPVAVEVNYEDRTFASYDKEDDVWMNAESSTDTITEDVELRAFVELKENPSQLTTFELLTEEIEISEPRDD